MNPIGRVWFVDVGQGHATLVMTADGTTMVIDCPAQGCDAVSDILGGRRLTAVVVTHRDLDHSGGIPELIRRHGVTDLYMNLGYAVAPSGRQGVKVRTVLRDILSATLRAGGEPQGMVLGQSGTHGSLKWKAFAPRYQDVCAASLTDRSNPSSVVIRLELGGTRFLITGDTEGAAARRLVPQNINADVLLAPHHGAKSPHLDRLVRSVDPSYSIVSASRVDKKHPARQTLDVLSTHRGRLLCTQASLHCHAGPLTQDGCAGTIRFEVHESGLNVSPSADVHGTRIAELSTPVCLSPTR